MNAEFESVKAGCRGPLARLEAPRGPACRTGAL